MHSLKRAPHGLPRRVGNRAALPAEGLVENAARFSTLRAPGARQCGFTLVELILVIALSAVVAVMVSTVLSRPLEGFAAQSRRAALVDTGSIALNRMQRDIRMAVPGSLRMADLDGDGANDALEVLLIEVAGRYLANRPSGQLAFEPRNPTASPPQQCIGPEEGSPPQPACDVLQVLDPHFAPPSSAWLVLPSSGLDVWDATANPGAIGRAGIEALGVSEGIARFRIAPETGSTAFAAPSSSSRRLYFATRVVGYRCVGTRLLRYEHAQLLPALPVTLPAGARVQAEHVASCSFLDDAAASQATLRLNIAQAGEAVRLVQFVQVNNAP
ncbi:prepilin-type N-terminal cleavage/methylation domain-containing protein [Pseudomonas stutzeri]|nr:prepilin-type N-terminal cleavage/methylation domain-containing protein [Stutzerimonas stutzeri]